MADLEIPEELFERLQAEAERQQLSVSALVREAITDYLEGFEDLPEETPDEDIEAGFLRGWHDVMTGRTRPARDVLKEIRKGADGTK